MAGSLSDWFKAPNRAEQLRAANVREDLVQAVTRTAFSRQSDRLLLALPEVLSDDEVVIALIEGRSDKQTGLLLLTTRRVLFTPKAAPRAQLVVVDLVDVVSVAGHTHRGMGVVTLTTHRGPVVVDQILGTQADTFAASVLQTKATPASRAAAERDPIDELIELRTMHRAGVVSDAEFRLRKQQLFDRI